MRKLSLLGAEGLIHLFSGFGGRFVIGDDPLHFAGPNFILGDATGFAGTGFNDGRGAALQLAGAPSRDQDVAIVAIEAFDQLHVLPQSISLAVADFGPAERIEDRLDTILCVAQPVHVGPTNLVLIFFRQ